MRFAKWWSLPLVVLVVVCLSKTALSADKKKPTDDSDHESVYEAHPYSVPTGEPDELVKYIEFLSNRPLPGRTFAEKMKERVQSLQAIKAAADKILKSDKASDEATSAAVGAKLESLTFLIRLRVEGAKDELERFTAEVKNDPRDLVKHEVAFYTFAARLREAADNDSIEELKRIAADVGKYFEKNKLTTKDLSLAMAVPQSLESADELDAAAKAYATYGPLFAKSDDPELASAGKKMAGAARRMKLIGKPMPIEGTTLAGKKFDVKQFKGKVVLVDFFATWCGPCMQELPNVLDSYAQYHDKGFEVVGISLDDEKDRLEEFVEKREIPWTILFGADDASRGWDHPMVVNYGVMGIPQAILVDQQGKVHNLNARGKTLRNELKALLGPAEKSGKSKADAKTGDAKKRDSDDAESSGPELNKADGKDNKSSGEKPRLKAAKETASGEEAKPEK